MATQCINYSVCHPTVSGITRWCTAGVMQHDRMHSTRKKVFTTYIWKAEHVGITVRFWVDPSNCVDEPCNVSCDPSDERTITLLWTGQNLMNKNRNTKFATELDTDDPHMADQLSIPVVAHCANVSQYFAPEIVYLTNMSIFKHFFLRTSKVCFPRPRCFICWPKKWWLRSF